MSFSDVSDLLLTYIVTYGAVVLGVVFLVGAVGVPLPSTLCVVAGGAFIQQGVLDLGSTIALGLAGVLLGDILSYGMGHLLRRPIERRYGQSAIWQRAEQYFARRGGIAIFLTRCVLTPIALPINLIAGSSDFRFGRFVAYDAAGELTWLLGYGALGYFFGSQWEYVSDLISNASGMLVGLLIAGVGAYALIRWNRRPATAPSAPTG
jgi:membrane protein DedA with SNARE-associated domain